MFKNQNFARITVIVILTFLVLYPVLQNGFTNWDDELMLTENAKIRAISLENLKLIFTSFNADLYTPLVLLSFMIEYAVFGLTPFFYHAINLLLHAFNAVLVFWMLMLIFGKGTAPFLAALLFAVHPLHVESVAWISERKDLLYSAFYLLSIIAYLYNLKEGKKYFFYLSAAAFLLSLLSKPMAVTLPAILLLIDYYFSGKIQKKDIISKSLLFVFSIIFIVITIIGAGEAKTLWQAPKYPFYHTIFVGGYGIVFYIVKTILPFNLSAYYPYPEPAVYIIYFACAVIIAYFIYKYSKKDRRVLFAALFTLITILPVLQLVPSSKTPVADRYFYLPSVGILYLLSEFLVGLYKKFQRLKYYVDMSAAAVIILAVCSLTSHKRCHAWKDSVSLWSDVIDKYRQIALAYNNRGHAYTLTGQFPKAIDDYMKAVSINPGYAEAYYNAALTYMHMGNIEKAIENYSQAIRLCPEMPDPYFHRAVSYYYSGKYELAKKDVDKSMSLGAPENKKFTELLRIKLKNEK